MNTFIVTIGIIGTVCSVISAFVAIVIIFNKNKPKQRRYVKTKSKEFITKYLPVVLLFLIIIASVITVSKYNYESAQYTDKNMKLNETIDSYNTQKPNNQIEKHSTGLPEQFELQDTTGMLSKIFDFASGIGINLLSNLIWIILISKTPLFNRVSLSIGIALLLLMLMVYSFIGYSNSSSKVTLYKSKVKELEYVLEKEKSREITSVVETPTRTIKRDSSLLYELRDKNLISTICNANNYLRGGSLNADYKASELYRQAINRLSPTAKAHLNQELLTGADKDFKNSYYSSASIKYKVLFKEYYYLCN